MPKDHSVQWDDELFELLTRAAARGDRAIGAQIRHYAKRGLREDGLLAPDVEVDVADPK